MKASFRVRPDLTVEVEGETHKDLFRELAGVCEVFGEQTCGLCGGAEIVPAFRTVGQGKKTFEYPEWHCQGCGARLSLGSMMEGGRLFPHRKLDSAGKPDREHGTFGAPRLDALPRRAEGRRPAARPRRPGQPRSSRAAERHDHRGPVEGHPGRAEEAPDQRPGVPEALRLFRSARDHGPALRRVVGGGEEPRRRAARHKRAWRRPRK